MRTSALFLLSLFAAATAFAARLPVQLDGSFEDWAGTAPLVRDGTGDGGASGIDLGRLWAADDSRELYLRFETGTELLLNGGNGLVIYLDTDADSATGLAVGGIGAELEWKVGEKLGTFRAGASARAVVQAEIGFLGFPTVTGSDFEVAFSRAARPGGGGPLFPGPRVRLLIRDTGLRGDRAPDEGTILEYAFDQGDPPADSLIPLGRLRADDVRLITWNIHDDSMWSPSLQPKFRRVLQALRPDVLNLQEIYDHTPEQAAALIESFLPSRTGEAWHAAGDQDCITLSRFPIARTWSLDGNLAVLLEAIPEWDRPFLVLNCHLPCCTDDDGRRREIDSIGSFLRDRLAWGGRYSLPEGTPIALSGDLNLVGQKGQLTSLLTGDIADNLTYGRDYDPDWDGTPLADLVSRQTQRRLCYTWRNDGGRFWPGRLDFWIYTDSALESGNHYLLYPPEMWSDTLAAHGLLAGDAPSDHLVHCADFRPKSAPPVAERAGCPSSGARGEVLVEGRILWSVSPNPGVGPSVIGLDAPGGARVRIELFDVSGRRRAVPVSDQAINGRWSLEWPGTDGSGRPLPPGVYTLRLSGSDGQGAFACSRKWLRIR